MMLSLCLLALCLITTAKSQFHPDCSTQKALSKRRCCPVYIDGSECGSSSGRGSCRRYQLHDPNITDTRCNWPYQQYDEVCSCNGNYDGPDCGDCKPYYHGPTCSEIKPCLRKELRDLTAAEKKQFIDAICLAKTTPSTRCVVQTGGTLGNVRTYTFEPASEYDCIVAIHTSSAMDVKEGGNWTNQDVLHRGPAFCPGHRCLLIHFERLLQQVSGNSSLCLPYWDWTKDGNTCAVCTDDLLGRVGTDGRILAPSCFANWRIMCGNSTTHSFCQHDPDPTKREFLKRTYKPNNVWPSQEDVDRCISNWPLYDSYPFDERTENCFRSCLEGFSSPSTGKADGDYIHNSVHIATGGDMGYLTRASNDPMFYCHHAQADRICAMWQWKNCISPNDYPTDGVPPCQGPNDAVYPAMPRRTMRECMRMPAQLGYSYSDFNRWPAPKCRAPPPSAYTTATTTTRATTTRATTTRTTTTRTTTKKKSGFLLSWLGK